MKRAFLFPGQGAQYPGMGKDFHDAFSIAKETFQEADDLLSYSLSKIIFDGPENTLTETQHSQCAIFVCSVAILRTLMQQFPDFKPLLCAGLSLGEYTALYASSKIHFADALRLVQKRAQLMNEACEETTGTMAAVLGLSAQDIEIAVKDLSDVWVANYNAPGQTVISGTRNGIERAIPMLKARGAKRVLPLQVHGAFHSGLMSLAQKGLESWIAEAPWVDSSIELVMNVPGDFVSDLDQMKMHLANQVTCSVKWEQSILAIESKGIDGYFEIGCGKTLSGLNKKIGVKAPTFSIEKVHDLEEMGAVCSC